MPSEQAPWAGANSNPWLPGDKSKDKDKAKGGGGLSSKGSDANEVRNTDFQEDIAEADVIELMLTQLMKLSKEMRMVQLGVLRIFLGKPSINIVAKTIESRPSTLTRSGTRVYRPGRPVVNVLLSLCLWVWRLH